MGRLQRIYDLWEYNGEPVVTQPDFEACEHETAIYFSKKTTREGYVQVSSNNAPIVRGLLAHGDFILEEITAIGPESAPRVVYVAGRLPTSCVRITSARGSSSIGKIITQEARRYPPGSPRTGSHGASAREPIELKTGAAV